LTSPKLAAAAAAKDRQSATVTDRVDLGECGLLLLLLLVVVVLCVRGIIALPRFREQGSVEGRRVRSNQVVTLMAGECGAVGSADLRVLLSQKLQLNSLLLADVLKKSMSSAKLKEKDENAINMRYDA
jgi:hypothetical protein